MNNYKIISKRDYRHSQNNNLLIIKEYVVVEKNGDKFLMLKLNNNFTQTLKSYSFDVVQKDINGNYIATSNFAESNISITKKSKFISKITLKIDNACEDIQLELKTAVFDRIIYDNGKTYNISNSIDKKLDDGVKEKKISKFPIKYAILPFFITLFTVLTSFFWVDYYKKHNFSFTIENFDYSFVGDEIREDSDIIINSYHGNEINILIPEKVKNHKIVEISNDAFSNNDVIQNIKFESDIKINNGAFFDCSNLKTVNFDEISYIGDYAFQNCTSLESFNSSKIKHIGNFAFSFSGLKDVNIKNEDEINIGDYAFGSCHQLKNFSLDAFKKNSEGYKILVECYNLENLYVKDYQNIFENNSLSNILYYNFKEIKLKNFKTEYLYNFPIGMFSNFGNLETVSVTKLEEPVINEYAFSNCKSLNKLDINSKIEKVGKNGLSNTKLEYFDGSNLKYIDERAFENCTQLKDVNLSQECSYISDSAFINCLNLEKIYLSRFINKIENSTFENCKKLRNVYLSTETIIKSLGSNAFAGCESLTELNIKPLFDYVGEGCFKNCKSLTSIDLGQNIRNIPKDLFNGCSSLFNIDDILNDNVNSIGENAFSGCNTINELVIPSNINFIGKNAFSNCEGLKYAFFNENYNIDQVPEGMFNSCINLQSVNLPSRIVSISKQAFESCVRLEKINLPETLNSIGDNAFTKCENLKIINIPDEIEKIGSSIFKDCSSLQSLTIPFVGENIENTSEMSYLFGEFFPYNITDIKITKQSNIPYHFVKNFKSLENLELLNSESIAKYAFSNCENLNNVFINNETKKIEYPIFDNCNKLESLSIPSLIDINGSKRRIKDLFYEKNYYNDINLKKIKINSIDKINSETFAGCINLEDIEFEHLDSIEKSTFYYNSKLKKINLGTGFVDIPYQCFYSCSNLEEIIFSDNTQNIDSEAFWGCSKLSKLELPKNILSIGDYAFRDCKKLTSVVIPSSLESFSNNVFSDCNSLYEIVNLSPVDLKQGNYRLNDLLSYTTNINGRLKSFTIDNATFAIKDGMYYLVKLDINEQEDNLKLPENVEFEGKKFDYAIKSYLFSNIDNIKNIIIPNCVSNIQLRAFEYSSLQNIEFDKNSHLMNISEHAFAYTKLEKIFLPEGLKKINNYSFADISSLITIGLPSTLESIDEYAFSQDSSVLEIYNLSKLPIKLESDDYGHIATNALIIHKSMDEDPLKKVSADGYTAYIAENLCVLIGVENNSQETLKFPDTFKYNDKVYSQYKIGNNFSNNSKYNVKKIIIPNSVTEIGARAFNYYDNLKEVVIEKDSNLKKIKGRSFEGCRRLFSINLPNSLESIGESAFSSCRNLCSIVIGENVNNIGFDAFRDCNSLVEIYNLSILDVSNFEETGRVAENALVTRSDLNEKGYQFIIKDNSIFFVDDSNELYLLHYIGEYVDKYITPENIGIEGTTYNEYTIFKHAFEDSNIREMEITKNVKAIQEYAFYNIYGLNKVVFKDDSIVTIIPNACFSYCNNLVEVILPNKLEFIDIDAFRYCGKLSSIEIPKTIGAISNNAFDECKSLFVVVNYSDLNVKKGTDENGKIGKYCEFIYNKPSKKIDVKLKEINLDQFNFNVMIIDGELYVFNNKNNFYIDILKLPSQITIDQKTYDTYSLAGVLWEWNDIKTVILPKAIKNIFGNPFKEFHSLDYVLYGGTKEEWNEMKIKDLNILNSNIKFYNTCVHDNESWTYDKDGTCVYNFKFNNKKIIKEPTCTEEGIMEFDCELCKQHVTAKIEKVKHIPGTTCKHCNKNIKEINDIYRLFNGNFYYNNSNEIYKIINHSENDKAELYSNTNMIGTYEFDFIINPDNKNDKLKFYLNEKLIKEYTNMDGFIHYSIDLNKNDKFKMVYEIADSKTGSKELFYIKNIMFLS